MSVTTTWLLLVNPWSTDWPLKIVPALTLLNGKLGTLSNDNLAVVSVLSSWILRVAVLYWLVVSAFTIGTLKTKVPPSTNVNKFNFENNFIVLIPQKKLYFFTIILYHYL